MRLSRDSLLVFLLGLTLLVMPFSRMTHAHSMPQPSPDIVSQAGSDTQLSMQIMPCHGSGTDTALHICPETGLPGCQCCDLAVPMGLSLVSMQPVQLRYLAGKKRLQYLQLILTRPQVPPFRPPRLYV